MHVQTISAGTQYGDLKGTASADYALPAFLSDFAEKHAVDTEKYEAIGIELYTGDPATRGERFVRATILALERATLDGSGHDAIQRHLDGTVEPKITKISFSVSIEEFLDAFKMFDVSMMVKVARDRQFNVIDDFSID